MFSVKNIFWKRLLDACSAVHTNTIERNSSKYRVDAKRMYREYTRWVCRGLCNPQAHFYGVYEIHVRRYLFLVGCGAVVGLDWDEQSKMPTLNFINQSVQGIADTKVLQYGKNGSS